MEEGGGKTKKTIFVGGIGEDVDEQVILESFSTFGGSCAAEAVFPVLTLFQAISSTFNSQQTQQADRMRIVCILPRIFIAYLTHLYSCGSEASRLCLCHVFVNG